MPSRCLAIFDLDGTLVDSAPGIVRSLDEVLRGEGLVSPLSFNQKRYWSMRGSRALVRRAWPVSLSEREEIRYAQALLADYRQNCLSDVSLFPGVENALGALSLSGWEMAVCTNKNQDLAQMILQELGLSPRFSMLVGGDTCRFKKPSGKPLCLIMEQLAISPQNCVMVGDTLDDFYASCDAGVPCVMCDFYGFLSMTGLETKPPIIYSWRDLVPALRNLFPVAFLEGS